MKVSTLLDSYVILWKKFLVHIISLLYEFVFMEVRVKKLWFDNHAWRLMKLESKSIIFIENV
jgi:hypothetical protein